MRLFSGIGGWCLLWLWLGGAALPWWPAPLTLAATTRQNAPASTSAPETMSARVSLDAGWQFPLVNVREPITYRLHIERDAQVMVMPESVTPEALRRALVRATTLPPELFDIVGTSPTTAVLSAERVRDTIEFTVRFSKPGAYSIPSLPITYSLATSPRTPYTLQSTPTQGYLLTVDAHLPVGTGALPGDLLAPPPLAQYAWSWLRYVAFALLAGGALALLSSFLLGLPHPRQRRRRQRLTGRQLRQKYQTELHHHLQQSPTLAGSLSPETRAWLRHSAALVRRLLGEWASGEPLLFAGGAGVSTAMVLAHLQLNTAGQETPCHPALRLLEELDVLATAPTPALTVDDSQRIGDTIQNIILQLTSSEATRVLRVPTRL